MTFDNDLMFIKDGEIQQFNGGDIGEPLDLGVPNQLAGRHSFVVVFFKGETTATGEIKAKLKLIMSDDKNFADPVEIPLSTKPYTKEEMSQGRRIIAPSPVASKRYVKLAGEIDGTIACSKGIDAGFVLDAPMGW